MCIYSHPDVCMHDHVNRILRIAKKSKQDIPLHLLLAMVLHDMGKATKEFQDYLNGGKRTTHALLSAFYTLYVCKERFKLKDEDCFWSFFYVERHHSDLFWDGHGYYLLYYIDRINGLFNSGEIEKELKKARSIDYQQFKHFVDFLDIEDQLKEKLLFDLNDFFKWVKNSGKPLFDRMKKRFLFVSFPDGYFWGRLSEFSLLLDTDKSSAALRGVLEELPLPLSPDSIEEYTKNLQSPLKQLRDEAYRHVFSSEAQGRVFTLTLPTGMGKTLTGLSFALKHEPARIIYALPFLSVIEQVRLNLERLGLKIGQDFVVHHHLTEYPTENSEEDHNLFRVLVEGWRAPIILTTFYQLFHTIFPWQNPYIRRLDRLRNSFIILDEVQALPVRYWDLVGKAIEVLTQELSCKVLYMTATQPYFTPSSWEIVDVNHFRLSVNRYNLEVRFDVNSLDALVNFFKDLYEQDKRYLIVLNTIASAREVYSELKKYFPSVVHLSTMLVPVHRAYRIREIADGKHKIVVSTQLIEAGVDLDFDVVIRDFAPLDSIVQTAGRANRNAKSQQGGKVFVIRLDDGKYARSVYDIILLSATEDFLKNKSQITESQLLQELEKYFSDIKQRIYQEESNELLKHIQKCNFHSMRDFTLIDDEPYKESVFVCVDDKAREILEKARNIADRLKDREMNIFEAKREFEAIKGTFYSYVINAKPEGTQKDPLLKIYVTGSELYNEEVGFTGKLNEQIW